MSSQSFPPPSKIVISHSNTGFMQTYVGVRTGGTRLYKEIIHSCADIEDDTGFIVIAHSLGGIFSRFAFGLMYDVLNGNADTSTTHEEKLRLSKLIFCSFLTMCTPHLGIVVVCNTMYPHNQSVSKHCFLYAFPLCLQYIYIYNFVLTMLITVYDIIQNTKVCVSVEVIL